MASKFFYMATAVFLIVVAALVLVFIEYKPPITEKCGIENCHGMDIVCGPNVPDACTAMYMLGDRCRMYAECKIVGGKCTVVKNQSFDECKSCVEKCSAKYEDDPINLFSCESNCPNEIPDESRYCVDNFGNPREAGACSNIPLGARICSDGEGCIPTCGNGCVSRNFDMSGIGDCKAIPQYECECEAGFCVKK